MRGTWLSQWENRQCAQLNVPSVFSRCSVCVHPTDCTEQESQGEGPLEYEVKQVTVFFWFYKMLAMASSFEPISLNVDNFYSLTLNRQRAAQME